MWIGYFIIVYIIFHYVLLDRQYRLTNRQGLSYLSICPQYSTVQTHQQSRPVLSEYLSSVQ